MTPKKLHRKNCTEFVSHVLETLEDERLEPTAMTHLERKIIKTKPPGNYVPCVNLQGCKGFGDCMATAFLAKTRRGSQNSVEYPGLGTKICGVLCLNKKWPKVFVGTMLAPSKNKLKKNNPTESILNLNISMIFHDFRHGEVAKVLFANWLACYSRMWGQIEIQRPLASVRNRRFTPSQLEKVTPVGVRAESALKNP